MFFHRYHMEQPQQQNNQPKSERGAVILIILPFIGIILSLVLWSIARFIFSQIAVSATLVSVVNMSLSLLGLVSMISIPIVIGIALYSLFKNRT